MNYIEYFDSIAGEWDEIRKNTSMMIFETLQLKDLT